MSFGIGDKVVFTAYSNPKFNDYGTVVDLVTHHDGSTSPVVRFNGSDELMYPTVRYLEIVHKFPRHSKSEPIDEQTIMFWNLQLQFMELSCFTLVYMLNDMIMNGSYRRNEYSRNIFQIRHDGTNKQRDCIATHLALQLSGIEE